jgi:hypothetical protein
MPWYELWIADGDRTLPSENAKDPAHAVAIFGNKLGLRLTLEDQGVVAPYMLREEKKQRPEIPVWSRSAR